MIIDAYRLGAAEPIRLDPTRIAVMDSRAAARRPLPSVSRSNTCTCAAGAVFAGSSYSTLPAIPVICRMDVRAPIRIFR
jgi:hypothetical protein